MIHTIEAQPCTGSPYSNFLAMIKIRNANATKSIKIPTNDANAKGFVENPIMPSIEYLNSFQKDHFVVPATLSIFSYSNHFVLKPTHGKCLL